MIRKIKVEFVEQKTVEKKRKRLTSSFVADAKKRKLKPLSSLNVVTAALLTTTRGTRSALTAEKGE